jgi:hypothetical protein
LRIDAALDDYSRYLVRADAGIDDHMMALTEKYFDLLSDLAWEGYQIESAQYAAAQ